MCKKKNIPNVPDMSQQEQDALAGQRSNIDQMQKIGGQYGNVMQTVSGLFNPDGSINPTALQNFGTQMQNYYGSQQGIYDTALAQGQAEDQLYRQALAGTGPISEGLKQQKQKEFETFKQAAGQRGIRISGSSWDDASSDSTAGIRMISEQQKRYDLAADNERTALRQWGSAQALNRMGSLASYDPTASRMGYFNNATMGMMPVLSGINQQWAGYMQPYHQQRMAQYQVDAQNAMRPSGTGAVLTQVGQLVGAGIGAYFGGPAGAAIGSNAGANTGNFVGNLSTGDQNPYQPMQMPMMGGMGGFGGGGGGGGMTGTWQGSYNQYAAKNGLNPNQYAPPGYR